MQLQQEPNQRDLIKTPVQVSRRRFRRMFPKKARTQVRPETTAVQVAAGVTVLIPAYNESKFVADTIRSVQAQSFRPARIVVVDDCSTDRTGEVAATCGPDVVVVRPEKNCGSKASALNYGLTFVSTEFTLAIDADTTLAPDAIEKLMVHFDREGRVGIVCGMVIPRRVSTVWERGRYIEYLYAFTFYKPIQDYYERPLIASGCFSAYRTDLLREIGGPAHNGNGQAWSMRTVGEDMDLTWSVYRLGKTVRFVMDAVCYPVEPHSFAFLHKQLTRWSAGFAQNIRVHWKGALEVPYLRSMVAVAPWDAVMAVVGLFILIPLLTIFVHPLFILGYFLDIPTIAVPVLIMAAQRGETRRALASLPAFWLMRFINSVYVVRAFWNEFVICKSLHNFEKGH